MKSDLADWMECLLQKEEALSPDFCKSLFRAGLACPPHRFFVLVSAGAAVVQYIDE
jgi:hypothetical protein